MLASNPLQKKESIFLTIKLFFIFLYEVFYLPNSPFKYLNQKYDAVLKKHPKVRKLNFQIGKNKVKLGFYTMGFIIVSLLAIIMYSGDAQSSVATKDVQTLEQRLSSLESRYMELEEALIKEKKKNARLERDFERLKVASTDAIEIHKSENSELRAKNEELTVEHLLVNELYENANKGNVELYSHIEAQNKVIEDLKLQLSKTTEKPVKVLKVKPKVELNVFDGLEGGF